MAWQPRLSVFISATTADLGGCRTIAKEMLERAGIFPETQELFGPDHHKILAMLRKKIATCDALIALVGFTFGKAPTDDENRSYTQIEYDLAVHFGKPILVFMMSEQFPISTPSQSPEALRLQQEYRRQLLSLGHKCELFSSEGDLRWRLAEAAAQILTFVWRREPRLVHPPKLYEYFVGRESELAQLRDAVLRRHQASWQSSGYRGRGRRRSSSTRSRKRKSCPSPVAYGSRPTAAVQRSTCFSTKLLTMCWNGRLKRQPCLLSDNYISPSTTIRPPHS